MSDKNNTEAKYKLFVERTTASKLVWGLKDKGGWANSHSANDEKVGVIPFWSDKALAKTCARDEWKGYLPAMIPLAEFLEDWCREMAENDVLAGVNWDTNMLGKEADALALALDISEQLNADGTAVSFLNYTSVDEFIADLQAE